MGLAFLSAASSCVRPSFFSTSGTDLSALSAVILILDLFGRLRELLGLRVDARHDHRDIHRHVVILGEARKAVLLGNSRSLRLHLRIFRFVRLRAIVDLRNVLVGGHEALNMLFSELDLLHLLRSARAGTKQSESQKRREPQTQKPPTRGHHVSVSNERHGMVLLLDRLLAIPQFWPRYDSNRWGPLGLFTKTRRTVSIDATA